MRFNHKRKRGASMATNLRGISVGVDTLTVTVDGVSFNSLWDEFRSAQDIWNAGRSGLASLLTYNTIDSNDVLFLDGTAWDFEKASQFGAPVAGRAQPVGLRVGFPFQWWDGRIAMTKKFLRNATSQQVREQYKAALDADNHLLFRETLIALTTPILNASRPVNLEGVGLYSLYAGEDTPPTYLGKTFSSSHNHYLVSGAAAVEGQDLADLVATIQEHGFGLRGSSERIVIMVHPDDGAVIRGFRVGVTSPWDFIPATDTPAYLTDQTIVGDPPSPEFQGLPIFGSYGDALLSESYLVPAKYLVASATSGSGSNRNPLAFRQHPNSESRGLILTPGTEGHPLVGATYERGFGIAVRNRGAAAVMQVKASGSYAAPTIP